MSEKKTENPKPARRKAAAVLRVDPSAETAAWLKEQLGKGWRIGAEEWLATYLETLAEAGRDPDVFRLVESIAPGMAEAPAEVLHWTTMDEVAHRVNALRSGGKQLRLDVLKAETARLEKEIGEPKAPDPDLPPETHQVTEAAAEEPPRLGVEWTEDDDHDEADEPPPASRWDKVKERA